MPELDPPFRVVYRPTDLERVKAWAQKAAKRGLAAEFLQVLRSLHEKLSSAPETWGDPLYQLRSMGLVIYHRTHGMLDVLYGVDAARKDRLREGNETEA